MDHATPNLPSRDFDVTRRFYAALGFAAVFEDDGWMILTQDAMTLEFFPHPDLKPEASWFSCCLRLDDIDGFFARCIAAGIPQRKTGHPRVHPPDRIGGERMGALIDPDGSLLRFIAN